MILYRFMSHNELLAYEKGEELVNNTRWRPDCQGFCFFNLEETPLDIARSLNGIATMEVLALFRPKTGMEFGICQGKYADWRGGKTGWDEYRDELEFCTPSYNNEKMELVGWLLLGNAFVTGYDVELMEEWKKTILRSL